ncbi:MAG: hypothetical protein JNL82_17125 [Myxococcales bacterium]|nr:hypothetical protein [Myxococcales bacterium]
MRVVEAGESPRPRVARRRIARTRRVTLGRLTAAEREALCADAYAIYARYKAGVDRATFDAHFFADDAARVALLLGDDGALAGFACATIHRVRHAGREHAVYGALLFVDTRYRGADAGKRFALGEALRFKLREPRTPLAYMGVVTSPASYRMFAAGMPRFWPARGRATPTSVRALARAAVDRRGLRFVDEEAWLIRGLGAVRDPERLHASASLRGDPDAQFYRERNPGFADGMGMVIWVPLDLRNILGALARLVGLGRRVP